MGRPSLSVESGPPRQVRPEDRAPSTCERLCSSLTGALLLRFSNAGWHSAATMPIRPEHRFFYPIDWPQLSVLIRFGRARGCCEGCGRPHGRIGLSPRRWPLVGRRCRPVARRLGASDPDLCGSRHPRTGPPDAGRPSRRPSGSRHFEQRGRQPRGLLSAMPHDPRPARASAQTVAHAVPAESARRPVRRTLRLKARGSAAFTASPVLPCFAIVDVRPHMPVTRL